MKPHFKVSAAKLVEGTDMVAECGKTIPKATFPFMLDLDALILDTVTIGNSARDRRECIRSMFEAREGRRYVYALMPGEESKHEDSDLTADRGTQLRK